MQTRTRDQGTLCAFAVDQVFIIDRTVFCERAARFFRKKHLKLLALISAAIGGAFCTSALAFAVTDLAKKGQWPQNPAEIPHAD
eukprot:s6737_g1.t1